MRSETKMVCNKNDGPEFKGGSKRQFLSEGWDSAESLPAADPPCSVSNGPRIYKYWKPHQVEDRFTKKHQNLLKWSKNYVPDMHPFGIVIFHDSLPSYTVAAMEDWTWSIWRLRARHPLRHSTELRRSATLIFVRMNPNCVGIAVISFLRDF